jgi:glycolate oxidase iron-sulfur subunit
VAFDLHRPPERDLIDICTHCGFCLPTCPTYLLWGEEMDSPRGRIVLMRAGLDQDGASPMSTEMATHFDRCLGCMACVTACPSGVQYDALIERVRPQVERNASRSKAERATRRAVFELFTRPGRLRVAAAFLPLANLARRGPLSRFPRLRALASLAPTGTRRSDAWHRLPEATPARAPKRATVGLLQGCVQRVFFHRVNAAAAHVLSAEGFDVVAPRLPGCCGALPMHAGEEPMARQLARRTIAAFDRCDTVAVTSAGCGSAMKEYGRLLDDDPAWARRAAAFSAKVRDISELLTEIEPRAERHPVPLKAAYHDACHLAHAQRVRTQPRALLKAIPGLELLEPVEWEICCGSAGIYNLLQPEAAADLGRRKASNLLATGADAIVAGNPGCALQISSHLVALGKPLPIHHPVEILDASIRGVAL